MPTTRRRQNGPPAVSRARLRVVLLMCLVGVMGSCTAGPPPQAPATDGGADQSSLGFGDKGVGPLDDTGPRPDLPKANPGHTYGEITSGAAVSTGGSYTLYSQVGHPVETKVVSAGDQALRWNVSIIPW